MLEKITSPADLKLLDLKKLRVLASEVRAFILEKVSDSGGHLASNLGVVELTLALHKFLDCPKDKIIWDVGHQCYPHKILTGRQAGFDKLRKLGGLSGFPKISESVYDVFGAGHASTSISAAMGIAEAAKKKGEKFRTVAVIGDGSLTGGLALEAINQIGYLKTKMTIILNDNKMSIEENVGALSEYTKRIESTEIYKNVKNLIAQMAKICQKNGKEISGKLRKLKEAVKEVGTPGLIFEKLGINYLGPIDGHNIGQIIEALKKADTVDGPTLIHIKTIKGFGYKLAEENAAKFHGVSPFVIENGKSKCCKNGKTFSEAFGQKLLQLAKKDQRIVAVTAAMLGGTGLGEFANVLPDQFFNVGICEEHAVTFAAGLAAQGAKPVVAIYSTFLQRAYDQIIHDVCLQKLPVIFAIDRAGLVGEDGPTHHGVFDLSFLRHIPNLAIMAPKDNVELENMLEFAVHFGGPVALRYPRGCGCELESLINSENISGEIKLGKCEIIQKGQKLAIISVGNQIDRALELAKKEKILPTVINARFIKPIDEQIFSEIKNAGRAIIIEENAKAGGFGSAILEGLAKRKILLPVQLVGIEDEFVEMGEMEELREKFLV